MTRARGLWRRLKRALGLEPSEDEPAFVPSGSPRRPLGVGSVALELPREPEDLDVRGHEAP